MIASVGSSILGSGTFSIRTSPAAYMTVARMGASFRGTQGSTGARAGDRPCCSRYWQGLPALGRTDVPWLVDTRSEIREFLTSRRARITPEQAGLNWYGENRRVPGLRREEVALLAGVSVDYYTRLERGNLAGVSETVLEALARALQLDEAERVHLYDLARASQPSAGALAARGRRRSARACSGCSTR